MKHWKPTLLFVIAIVATFYIMRDTCNCKNSVIQSYSANGNRSGSVTYMVWLRGVRYDGSGPCVRGVNTSEYYFIHQQVGDSIHLPDDPWP